MPSNPLDYLDSIFQFHLLVEMDYIDSIFQFHLLVEMDPDPSILLTRSK